MSRLAEAETKLAAALEALEAAITARTAADTAADTIADSATEHAEGAGLDRQAILAEIGRIDGQIAGAMKAIETARHATTGEGGTA